MYVWNRIWDSVKGGANARARALKQSTSIRSSVGVLGRVRVRDKVWVNVIIRVKDRGLEVIRVRVRVRVRVTATPFAAPSLFQLLPADPLPAVAVLRDGRREATTGKEE